MLRKLFYPLSLALLFTVTSQVAAQESTTRTLTLEEATRMADAAEERAQQDNWNVVISVVDAGGHLILLRKMDGTQIGSIDFAVEKARSSVYFKRPTKAFQDAMANSSQILGLTGAVPFEGGVPIEHNGEVIGAVGVSGVTAEQDGIIAQAGVDAL